MLLEGDLKTAPTILITGATGQVGQALAKTMTTLGRVVALKRSDLNLTDVDAIATCLKKRKPDVILNAAAYTAVDRAEDEKDVAFAINAKAPEKMAEIAKELGSVFVHYSTDYVFAGLANRAYREDEVCAPLNVYGQSKEEGERLIAKVGGRFLILRTSWVYSAVGTNFLRTMLRLAKERKELSVVDDQRGSPTSANSLALATSQIVAQILSPACQGNGKSWAGLYHLTASGETTWFGFAQKIFEKAGSVIELRRMATRDYVSKAQRPLYSVLDQTKIQNQFGIFMPDWQESLQGVMSELGF